MQDFSEATDTIKMHDGDGYVYLSKAPYTYGGTGSWSADELYHCSQHHCITTFLLAASGPTDRTKPGGRPVRPADRTKPGAGPSTDRTKPGAGPSC